VPQQLLKMSENGWYLCGSATADVEMDSIDISLSLQLVQGKCVHRGKLFLEYCRGAWGCHQNVKIYPSVNSATSSKRCRRKNIRLTAIVLRSRCARQGLSPKNLSFEKSKMAELCSIEFVTCTIFTATSEMPSFVLVLLWARLRAFKVTESVIYPCIILGDLTTAAISYSLLSRNICVEKFAG
jgi:hypothetical protein